MAKSAISQYLDATGYERPPVWEHLLVLACGGSSDIEGMVHQVSAYWTFLARDTPPVVRHEHQPRSLNRVGGKHVDSALGRAIDARAADIIGVANELDVIDRIVLCISFRVRIPCDDVVGNSTVHNRDIAR